jgi:hypothetical protein
MMTRSDAVSFLLRSPYKLGHLVGFNKLRPIHNAWIIDMVKGKRDKTLQAHRGSYKTTCVSVALSLIIVLLPNVKTLFMRKTDNDIKEVVAQVKKILESPQMRHFVKCIYGVDLKLTTSTANEITTNLCQDIRGTAQLVGMGMGGSLTGKHFDRIFTDDIVNVQDRFSKAERDRTKLIYQELRNIINRGGRIYNTGTPWHKEDAFTLMPNPEKWDCYSTGLIDEKELAEIKENMTASLFSANYELRHVAAEDVIFTDPRIGGDPAMVEQGESHIDAAYGGEDYTAFTVCRKVKDTYYIYGRLWKKHVDDVESEIIALHRSFNAGRIHCEDNGDKGYLAKDLRQKDMRVRKYHEDMNKYLKITSYLKAEWKNVVFVQGTDEEYINQICDFNENAEHDDAPDSCASMIRALWKKNDDEKSKYQSVFMRG